MTVATILKQKGHDVVAVAPGLSAEELARLLRKRRIGAVLVQERDGALLGIVSERDLVFALAERGAGVLNLTAGELMTPDPITTSPDATLEEVRDKMTNRRVRHLPVLEAGRVVGLVSIGDVVKARIDQQEYEVDSLKAYVAGAT